MCFAQGTQVQGQPAAGCEGSREDGMNLHGKQDRRRLAIEKIREAKAGSGAVTEERAASAA